MLVTLAVMVSLFAPAQANEAETLFKKMEDKVAAAKTLQLESETVVEGKKQGKFQFKATLAEGNKINFQMTMEADGRTETHSAVSDGTNLLDKREGGKKEPTPKNLNAVFSTMFTRMGPGSFFFASQSGGEDNPLKADKFDKEKAFPVSDFKLGKKEKVGDREAQSLTFTAGLGNGAKPDKVEITLWLDTKTDLPLKRTFVFDTPNDGKITVTETVKAFKLAEKVDPKLFELSPE